MTSGFLNFVYGVFIGGISFALVQKCMLEEFLLFGNTKCKKKKSEENDTPKKGSEEAEKELYEEQLSRVISFFGNEGHNKIKDAFVIVIGLGGVGSHTAHMLARSGVGKLRLIDFDNVTLSSLSRHAVATRSDVGLSKVRATKNHIKEIVPSCIIEDLPVMFEESCADDLLSGNPTYVVDCIDDVKTKVELLCATARLGLKVITATGAGAKADPTRLYIGNLTDAIHDPLASKIRYCLRKSDVDLTTITTVFSSEKSRCDLLPLDPEQVDNPNQFGNVDNFRIRVIPVLGTMPAIFGQAMAAFILTAIAGKPIKPEEVTKLSKEQRNKFFQKFQNRETELYNVMAKDTFIDKADIDFIYQQVWKGRSAVSGVRNGGGDRMLLSRWRHELPPIPSNIVLLTAKEAASLARSTPEEVFDMTTVSRIDGQFSKIEIF